MPPADRPVDLSSREKFLKRFGVTLAQLLAWEANPEFMALVRADNSHWITKQHEIFQALLDRGKDTKDKEQMHYAAAFLIAIQHPAGAELAKMAAAK